MTIALLFDHDAGNLDAVLVDIFTGQVVVAGLSEDDDEILAVQAPDGAFLDLEVYGVDGATNWYEIEVEAEDCRCEVDADCAEGEPCGTDQELAMLGFYRPRVP
jgi:hypothetical protein